MTDTTSSHRSFGDVVSRTVAAETAGDAEALEVLLDEEFRDAHAHCGRFFGWYNDEHRHSGIGSTPQPTCTTGGLRQSASGVPSSSTPPTPNIPNGSSASHPCRRHSPPRVDQRAQEDTATTQ
jgi:hypothetical protein